MYKKPLNLYEGLSLVRMSPAPRRAAIANLERAETLMDLLRKPRDVVRRSMARVARVFGHCGGVRYKNRNDYCRSLRNA